MKIGIIGCGWYGVHVALSLKKSGHDVILFEKNSDIFSNISGNFGIRLHSGAHYPRSEKTRQSCQKGHEEFLRTYPELVVRHDHSVYALGALDADRKVSKVNAMQFDAVCQEFSKIKPAHCEEMGLHEVLSAWDLDEPSIMVGTYLRNYFKQKLSAAEIPVFCHVEIEHTHSTSEGIQLTARRRGPIGTFDYVINATSYQSLLDIRDDFPFEMEVVYQPCLALLYEDLEATKKPMSMIVMDGWFPCIMPYCEKEEDKTEEQRAGRKYILTHGKWTTLGSCKTVAEANDMLEKLNDDFIKKTIKPFSEHEICRFFPAFDGRFRYIGWKASVLAKLATDKEFRGPITYEKDRVIYSIPGKISGIFEVEQEIKQLLSQQNILSRGDYHYIQGGVLDTSLIEISEKPIDASRNTCRLQTYHEITSPSTPHTYSMMHSFLRPPSPHRSENLICATRLKSPRHA